MDRELETKINIAIERIMWASRIATNRGNTLVVAYSGGKDSDALLRLAIKSEAPILVQHNHTTADAPETIYHIRDVFAQLAEQGIATVINYPPEIVTDDGKTVRANMWNVIAERKFPPTRLVRYCCEYFKERQFDGQHILTGVRWAESKNRKTRGTHEVLHKDKGKRLAYMDENDDAHKLADMCLMHPRLATNPIIDWTDDDVWIYLKAEHIKTNPLYGYGYKRVGCIGCPLAGGKTQEYELRMYPKYRAAYIKAFDRMLEHCRATGKEPDANWLDGEAVMNWWLQKDKGGKNDNQMVLKEFTNNEQ